MKVGDLVMFSHYGKSLKMYWQYPKEEVGMVFAISASGLYTIFWRNGQKTGGITRKDLKYVRIKK